MHTTLLESLTKHGIEVRQIGANDFYDSSDYKEFPEIATMIEGARGTAPRPLNLNKPNARYINAPLSFQGQKRGFYRTLINKLEEHGIGEGDGFTFVDVFGGSGLLSHHIKKAFPKASVIWNDFDDYHSRLLHIPQTNLFFLKLYRFLIEQNAFTIDKRISEEHKQQILQMVNNHLEEFGYVDYFTVSNRLLFSLHATTDSQKLVEEPFYNRCPLNPLSNAYGYLDGVIRVECDFRKLLASIREYACTNNIILVFDPPYIGTNSKGYGCTWGMEEQKAMLTDIVNLALPYVLFGSTKAQLLDFVLQASDFTQPIKERLQRYGYVLEEDAHKILDPFANVPYVKLAGNVVNNMRLRGEFMVYNFKRLAQV